MYLPIKGLEGVRYIGVRVERETEELRFGETDN